jgi:hypothetical protein
MQRIASLPRDAYAPVLPPGVAHAAAHARLNALLAQAAPEARDLFAAPLETAEATSFACADGRLARAADLDPEGRARLHRELGRLAGALRRAAQRRADADRAHDGDLPALVAAALEVPSFEQVFALGRDGGPGRPVLAGWGMAPAGAAGHAPLGLITRLDDGRPAETRRRLQPALIAAAAASLTLLAVGAAAALPWVAGRVGAPAPGCEASAGGLDALADLLREQQREQSLRARLAEIEIGHGQSRLACPLPSPGQMPEPEPRPQPASLPAERWQQRDLGLFEGCWNLRSDASIRWAQNGRVERIVSWRICFDRAGRGTQRIALDSGRSCEQPTRVAFDRDGAARITEIGRCSYDADSFKFRADHVCRRVGDGEASCETREVEGQARGQSFGPYRFER